MLTNAPQHVLKKLVRRPAPSIDDLLDDIARSVPPLWPLTDYVAVNPCVGLTERTFLEAAVLLSRVRDADLLPSWSHFRRLWREGEITIQDVLAACRRCADEAADLHPPLDAKAIVSRLEHETSPESSERSYYTVAEAYDRRHGSMWTSHFLSDITRHCAAYYDRGQAIWPNPWKSASLYCAWRDAAARSRRIDWLGVPGFHRQVAQLPEDPRETIEFLLLTLEIPRCHWRQFLQCELLSVFGWAGYVKYHTQSAPDGGHDDLTGLLAMRLAYDAFFQQLHRLEARELYPDASPLENEGDTLEAIGIPGDAAARHVLLVAAEYSYQRKLCGALQPNPRSQHASPTSVREKALQMVFCIDVRSEVFRRHLEALDGAIETFGFAGFFGMALEYARIGESGGAAQCPVLLRPAFRVQEKVRQASAEENAWISRRRWGVRAGRKIWKSFQTSAVSCFSFVESLGLGYGFKLLTDCFGLTPPVTRGDRDGLPRGARTGPALSGENADGLSLETRADLAAGMLRNLGLTGGFAPLVVVCGHASDVVNNPYRAGLDCGACGGHSGEPNARVAADLLNDRQIRGALGARGIEIPETTWFLPAVHHTTTDEIEFLDTEGLPGSHTALLAQVQGWVREAGERCREERSRRMGNCPSGDLFRRSHDWSEIRPEWGLAGNAAFIVAPRSRTRGLDLGGRVFMHSYDFGQDPEGRVLELIMTAPMIVTNWINLQYFASTVDNRAFGSGNKLIHDVAGQFGVIEGNGGDLKTGLPWQSVHDGHRLQHLPQRLLVIIEAPRTAVEAVVRRHRQVGDLAGNGWLTLMVLEGDRWFRWTANARWQAETDCQGTREAGQSVMN